MAGWASSIGHALRGVRHDLGAAGCERLPCASSITLKSMDFEDGGALPVRCTADGAGSSPQLEWSGIPEAAASLALLVEDVDAPLPRPIVHLVLLDLSVLQRGLAEGAVPLRGGGEGRMFRAGRNTFGHQGWLPPSPIPGHGPHRYVFQLIALREKLAIRRVPSRGDLLVWARRHAVGHGRLIGTYERS